MADGSVSGCAPPMRLGCRDGRGSSGVQIPLNTIYLVLNLDLSNN